MARPRKKALTPTLEHNVFGIVSVIGSQGGTPKSLRDKRDSDAENPVLVVRCSDGKTRSILVQPQYWTSPFQTVIELFADMEAELKKVSNSKPVKSVRKMDRLSAAAD
jgi:hypothetical protein